MNMKKMGWAWVVGTIVGLFKAFVLMNLWNWFVVPAFRIPEISYLLMLGVFWTIGLMTEKLEQPDELVGK